jgi:hypothetical protein
LRNVSEEAVVAEKEEEEEDEVDDDVEDVEEERERTASFINASAPKKCIKKRRRSNVVEKFRKVSDIVWISFEAVIIEKTIKEE